MTDHRCHVASGKNSRVGDALQMLIDLDKAAIVQRQPSGCQPRRAARLRDPDDFVGIDDDAARCAQAARLHLAHSGIDMHLHAALGQHRTKAPPHARVVRWQNVRALRDEVKAQRIGVAT